MESFFTRPDYVAAKGRVEKAIERYKATRGSNKPWDLEAIEELMLACYKMSTVIKEGNGFLPEKAIGEQDIDEALEDVEHYLANGVIREEAWALETLSRVIFRKLPTALFAFLNVDDTE